jgi:hypothetical protein
MRYEVGISNDSAAHQDSHRSEGCGDRCEKEHSIYVAKYQSLDIRAICIGFKSSLMNLKIFFAELLYMLRFNERHVQLQESKTRPS